ncbi:MAG: proline--tRNA ligase [Phycisphaerae bacterium]|jgi:prolyl-tRNA synthetase
MRWSRYFVPTTKETPKDATAPSHVLMLRAGLIRQLAAGLYSYLPLGYRTLRKVEQIVREEMDRAGAVELHMPVLQPLSLWQETGRVAAMGDVLLRLGGPEGDWRPNTVLGPTHEEVITEIARAYLNSYKQLPITLYQIQAKFRGEARPKSGILRTREFLMKDAYSFHAEKECLDREYDNMYEAYCHIFARCGLPYLAVQAQSGAIGGDVSHEFMVLTDAGEDLVVLSENGDYAANLERATTQPLPAQTEAPAAMEEVHTPGHGKVEDVCAFMGTRPEQMIKTLIYTGCVTGADGKERELRVVALVRGNHDVNEFKLNKAAGAVLELADPRVIEEVTGAGVGFAGPHTLLERIDLMVIDRDVTTMRNAASGANKTDYHVRNINPGRDFPIEGEKVVVADIRNAVTGDLSPTGSGSPLSMRTAIEIGHVFKLGTKYSAAMEAQFLTREGKPQPLIMGCYGIGVNRLVAAAIESHHDDNGIVWPMSIAPFHVLVMALDPRDDEVVKTAEQIQAELAAAGLEVLFDDRDERAGFKFKDADLVGIPVRIVVGRKSLKDGVVELSHRRDGVKQPLPPAKAIAKATAMVRDELAELTK